MSEQYYLPTKTAERVNAGYASCKNLGLILDKYTPRRVLEKRDGGDEKSNAERGKWLKEFESNNRIDVELVKNVAARWRTTLKGIQAQQFTATTDWRIIVGLGGETVLETDLTLHHLYGIPIIPGSALKGLTRAYVAGEVDPRKPKKLEEDNEDVKRIFGTQEKSGSVLFFDALPTGDINLTLDIMNAHYPKYYGEKQVPANNQNPNPITFLTVEETTFLFALAPRRPTEQDKNDVVLAQTWLQEALQKYGVGGKTSAGYGYFQEPTALEVDSTQDEQTASTPTPIRNPELVRVEDYTRELDTMKAADVAGRINNYYQEWRKLNFHEAKVTLAEVIIQTVRKAGREKASVEKSWYKELQAFLSALQ